MERKNIELLAPAGTWEALEAAVNAGADAVYLGGANFGARQYADNFGDEEMQRAVNLAHLHRVKLYVTVNTLVDDSEMADLGKYLIFLNNIGIDGIIVQDMGVVNLAKKIVPELPLHASTQMTVTNSEGVKFASEMGMERVVLARECTMEDIKKICAASDTEIEVFIHGALCVCYSGQCLMSSLIGGRSGNRGRCAQPCRLPYTLVNKEGHNILEHGDAGQYLLSPKDLNTLAILPQLLETGVVSYKIEERMNRPEYVAIVTDIYRRAIDSYLAGNYQVTAEDNKNIEQIFNRDFTTAYLEKPQGSEMMSDRRPNNRGVLVGRVTQIKYNERKAILKLGKNLHLGDGLEFWVSVGGRVGTTITSMRCEGQEVKIAAVGQQVEIDVPHGIKLNDRVFRTFDNELMTFAGNFYGEHNKKRIPLQATVTVHLGEAMSVVLEDEEGNIGCGITEFIVEKARKHALNEETVMKQLDRLGTSEYALAKLELICDAEVMVPMSEINEARRKATDDLNAKRLAGFTPKRRQQHWHKDALLVMHNHTMSKRAQLAVHVDTLDKAMAALRAGADWLIVGGDAYSLPLLLKEDYAKIVHMVKSGDRKMAIATSRIVGEKQLHYYERQFAYWQTLSPDLIIIANNGLWPMAKKTKLPLWLDYSLNQYNGQSLAFWYQEGAVGATLSPELTMGQVEHLAQETPIQLECLVQGPLEMMVSEYCVPGSFVGNIQEGKCSFNCKEETFLKDRKNEEFPLMHDQFGRTHILNGHDLSMVTNVKQIEACGITRLRIDARSYSPVETEQIVTLYRQVLNKDIVVSENLPHTTRGHYFRGVL